MVLDFADRRIRMQAISSLVDDRKQEAEPSEKIDVLQHMLGTWIDVENFIVSQR